MATKLTDETVDKLCLAQEMGLNQEESAIYAGITPQTLYNWINKGKKAKSNKSKYKQFYNRWKYAKIKNKAFHLKKVQEDKSWQSSAWYLERVYPDEFGKQTLEITGGMSVEHSTPKSFEEEMKEYEDYFERLESDGQSDTGKDSVEE